MARHRQILISPYFSWTALLVGSLEPLLLINHCRQSCVGTFDLLLPYLEYITSRVDGLVDRMVAWNNCISLTLFFFMPGHPAPWGSTTHSLTWNTLYFILVAWHGGSPTSS